MPTFRSAVVVRPVGLAIVGLIRFVEVVVVVLRAGAVTLVRIILVRAILRPVTVVAVRASAVGLLVTISRLRRGRRRACVAVRPVRSHLVARHRRRDPVRRCRRAADRARRHRARRPARAWSSRSSSSAVSSCASRVAVTRTGVVFFGNGPALPVVVASVPVDDDLSAVARDVVAATLLLATVVARLVAHDHIPLYLGATVRQSWRCRMPASGAVSGPAHRKVPVDRAVAGSRACRVSPSFGPRPARPAVRGSTTAVPVLPVPGTDRRLRAAAKRGGGRSGWGEGLRRRRLRIQCRPRGGWGRRRRVEEVGSVDRRGRPGRPGRERLRLGGRHDVLRFSGHGHRDDRRAHQRAAHGEPPDADRPRTEATLTTEQVGDRPLRRRRATPVRALPCSPPVGGAVAAYRFSRLRRHETSPGNGDRRQRPCPSFPNITSRTRSF